MMYNLRVMYRRICLQNTHNRGDRHVQAHRSKTVLFSIFKSVAATTLPLYGSEEIRVSARSRVGNLRRERVHTCTYYNLYVFIYDAKTMLK